MFVSFPTEEAARAYANRKGYIDLDYVETKHGGQLTILDRMMQRRVIPVVNEQAETEGESLPSAGTAGTEEAR